MIKFTNGVALLCHSADDGGHNYLMHECPTGTPIIREVSHSARVPITEIYLVASSYAPLKFFELMFLHVCVLFALIFEH